MTDPSSQVTVGRIGRAHGIRGEVSVDVRTDAPDVRFAPGAVLNTDRGTTMTVRQSRWHSGRLLVAFEGLLDRTAAEAARGTVLTIDEDAAGDAGDGAFWDRDLIGLDAVADDGEVLGTVEDVIHLPASELLSVRRPDGRELLVPFVAEIVPDVDVAQGRLTVVPPPGLLDL